MLKSSKKIDGNTTITIEKHILDIPSAYVIDDMAKGGTGRTSGNKSYLENYGTGKTSNKVPPVVNRENIHRNSNTQNYDYKVQDNSGSNGSSSGGSGFKKNNEPPVKDSGKTYTLESQDANWDFKSEIPRAAVKNSEGNYTLGRGNEWNFNTKYKTPYIGTGNKRKELVSSSSSRLYSAVPEMHELDKGRYTFRPNETGYVKNPTAQNITNYINNTNYLGTGGKKGSLNGLYMYVVDANNNIIIGNRAIGQVSGVESGKGLPHPTLIGGFEPKVQGAGIVTIQGGKIIKVDNASGHFKPDSSSLGKVEKLFLNKVPDKYYDRKFEGFVPYKKE